MLRVDLFLSEREAELLDCFLHSTIAFATDEESTVVAMVRREVRREVDFWAMSPDEQVAFCHADYEAAIAARHGGG